MRYQVFLYLLGVFKEFELISLVTTNWFNQKVSKKPFNLQNTGGLPIVPEGFHFSFNILTSAFPNVSSLNFSVTRDCRQVLMNPY